MRMLPSVVVPDIFKSSARQRQLRVAFGPQKDLPTGRGVNAMNPLSGFLSLSLLIFPIHLPLPSFQLLNHLLQLLNHLLQLLNHLLQLLNHLLQLLNHLHQSHQQNLPRARVGGCRWERAVQTLVVVDCSLVTRDMEQLLRSSVPLRAMPWQGAKVSITRQEMVTATTSR